MWEWSSFHAQLMPSSSHTLLVMKLNQCCCQLQPRLIQYLYIDWKYLNLLQRRHVEFKQERRKREIRFSCLLRKFHWCNWTFSPCLRPWPTDWNTQKRRKHTRSMEEAAPTPHTIASIYGKSLNHSVLQARRNITSHTRFHLSIQLHISGASARVRFCFKNKHETKARSKELFFPAMNYKRKRDENSEKNVAFFRQIVCSLVQEFWEFSSWIFIAFCMISRSIGPHPRDISTQISANQGWRKMFYFSQCNLGCVYIEFSHLHERDWGK